MHVLSLQKSTRVVNVCVCVCVTVCGVDVFMVFSKYCQGFNCGSDGGALNADAWLHRVSISLSVGSDLPFLGAQQLTDGPMPAPW